MQFIRGPLTTAVNVNRQSVAESNMMTSMQLTMTTSANNPGDCDGDTLIEPVPYKSAGSDPAPGGGGHIPNSIGASKSDPWGTEYGYCVWDHGAKNNADDAGCGGPSQNRLGGGNVTDEIALALISAGKDKKFQTSCNAYDPANPDDPLVDKSGGSDDIVFSRTYAEAGSSTGGIWKFKSGDPNTATLASGAENVATSGSLQIGAADSAGGALTAADCSGPADVGRMRYNPMAGGGSGEIEACDYKGGTYQWIAALGGTSGNFQPIFDAGTSAQLAVAENHAGKDITGLLTATDLNTDQQLTWTIAQSPDHGSLNGFSPTPPQESATVSVTPSGPLDYEPDDGYSGSGGGFDDDSFTIKVADSAGASRLLTVNVEISDKPDFDNGSSFSISMDEDAGPQSIESALAATDVDTGQTLEWSVASGPGSSGSLNNFNATASTNGGSVTPDTTPDLAYEPAADFNTGDGRSESFDIQVADGTDGSDTITGNVTVDAVNDAPDFTVNKANPAVNGDTNGASVADVVTGIGPGATNEGGQSLSFTFTVTSNGSAINNSSLSIDTNTGDLSVDTNDVGADTDVGIDVTLEDDGNTANGGADQTTKSFTLTVNAVATTIDCTDTSVLSSASPGDECNNGDIYAGEPTAGKYLIAAPSDDASNAYWGTYNYTTGATSDSDGASNTTKVYNDVQAGNGDYNPDDGKTPNAAKLCAEKSLNGHSDWYLPAKSELDTLYQNASAIGNFDTGGANYWSSTEDSISSRAWRQRFSDGFQDNLIKFNAYAVRCARRSN